MPKTLFCSVLLCYTEQEYALPRGNGRERKRSNMEQSTTQTQNGRKFHYAWVIALVGFFIYWFVICIVSNCVGMFVKPVSEALGISRSQFSLTTTFVSVASMIMSLVVSRLYRRFTIKRVMVAASVVLPLAYGCYSIAPNIYVFYVIAFITGFCMCALASVGVSTLISNWFNEKRGLAIAIAATGSGIGGIFMNPFIGSLITNFGFRRAYFVLAVMMAVTLIPCTLFLVRDRPSDMNLEPYGGVPEGAADLQHSGMTAAQARKSLMFWMWMPVCIIVSATCNCVMQHTVAYATDLGYEYSFAAGIASLITASLAVGKIVMGAVFDRIGSRRAAVLSLALFCVALALYWFADQVMVLYLAAAIIGFGLSFSTVAYSVVTQDLFGKKDFAGIYSTLTIFSGLGGALGSPLIAGVYDIMGSYRLAWAGLSLLMVVNILLINGMFAYKKKHIQ